ncbi:hypothetical protein [Pseudosporangium ferrugineum]|uniref:Colicin import membrane protein n=1 Tax=Pseudosporangium ferrugineum TaxID=439699 RepID=A0A2T0SI82_9ACTN|nr:hypothetical protein [Pseudosporangium ferrugineum]PRY33128.1 colicin import membrane protein [Pseudosporangium ferrugineum]
MRLRQRRGTGVNRKAIGAAVFAGVLVAGGITGLQFASAGEQTKAAEIVVVDGQNFDIAGCEKLEIDAGAVICDGEKLQPEQQMGANEAAAASAQALEESCDQFAIDQAAAAGEAAGDAGKEEAGNAGKEEAGAGGKAAAEPKSKRVKRAIAKRWAKKMGEGEERGAGKAGDKGAAGAGEQGDEAGQGNAEDLDAAVITAREGLLAACLTLADAKAAAGADAGDNAGADEAGADDNAGAEEQGADAGAGKDKGSKSQD